MKELNNYVKILLSKYIIPNQYNKTYFYDLHYPENRNILNKPLNNLDRHYFSKKLRIF